MATPASAFDWTKCAFCQQNKRQSKLNCPADSKRTDIGAGYTSVAHVIEGYVKLGQLPPDLKCTFPYWDEGNGIEATFKEHRARWHIKCKQRLIHDTKLGRLRKI